MSVNSGQHFS